MEKIEDLKTIGDENTYVIYNATTKVLRRQCIAYLENLKEIAADPDDSVKSNMTTLDRHRLNSCALDIESIIKRLKVNGELLDNHYLDIAMIHAYEHLQTIKNLCKDVSF